MTAPNSTLVLPIVNTILSTKVSLLPRQMNNDIYQNLKYNVAKKWKENAMNLDL
jgi:hypothetical protein